MKFIGITGGVGAGKTEILKYLSEQKNIEVMLADEIAHELMEPGTDCNKRLQQLFSGEGVFDEKGNILRNRMAEVIFADKQKRLELNEIVHPAVKEYARQRYLDEQKKGKLRILVLEAALLIEEEYDKMCDEMWYIYTSEENRKARLKENRGYSEEKINQIFKSQLTEKTYRDHCKIVIDNNGLKEDTIKQLAEVINRREYQL